MVCCSEGSLLISQRIRATVSCCSNSSAGFLVPESRESSYIRPFWPMLFQFVQRQVLDHLYSQRLDTVITIQLLANLPQFQKSLLHDVFCIRPVLYHPPGNIDQLLPKRSTVILNVSSSISTIMTTKKRKHNMRKNEKK